MSSNMSSNMSTYVVLGGTGSTGSAILRSLNTHSPSQASVRVLVRSEEKLLTLLPFLKTRPNTMIVQGAINDSDALKCALDGADFIFSTVALPGNEPGMTIAAETARSILASLKQLRQVNEDKYRPPVIVMLSSASVNPRLAKDIPRPLMAFLHRAMSYNYHDLEVAEDLYKSIQRDDPGLLDVIFAQPPAIMPGESPTGFRLSQNGSTESISISFADLGAGMIEMAERKEEFSGQGVTVIATGKVIQDWSSNIRELFFGLIAYFMPWFWRQGRVRGWW